MVIKMFLSVIYYQVKDMHHLSTVGSQHGQTERRAACWSRYRLIFLPYFCDPHYLARAHVATSDTLHTPHVEPGDRWIVDIVDIVDIDSPAQPQLCNPMWPGLSVIQDDDEIISSQ